VTEPLRTLVNAYLDFLTLDTIGESWEGRDVWLVTINNPEKVGEIVENRVFCLIPTMDPDACLVFFDRGARPTPGPSLRFGRGRVGERGSPPKTAPGTGRASRCGSRPRGGTHRVSAIDPRRRRRCRGPRVSEHCRGDTPGEKGQDEQDHHRHEPPRRPFAP